MKRGNWPLLNAWSPHWMFSTWSLRYLDDPRGAYGKAEQIHDVARNGFTRDFPQVANFFAHFTLPMNDLENLMKQARESSADQVVADYYAANKERFKAMFEEQRTAAAQ